MQRPDVRDITIGELLDEAVAKNPDGDAVVYVDRKMRLTYREFSEQVDRMAKGLMALGVQKGEKVGIWATNVPFWVTLQFATAKIGAILLTVNTSYKSEELRYLMSQSECENLFIIDGYRDTDYVQTVYDLVPELKTQERGRINSQNFPHLKRVMFLGHAKHRGMFSIPEIFSLASMISDEEYAERKASLHPDDVVNMQYTSGTTGFPKGVMLTHRGIGNNGYWIGFHQGFGVKDRVCLPIPLFHCFGCVLGTMACINHASSMIFTEVYKPLDVMAAIDQEKCTAVYGVPTMFIAMLEHDLFKRFDYSTLRTGIMAGSPCPVPIMKQVIDKMNMREITICYGLTESSPVMTQTRADDNIQRRTETVGRAMPACEVMVKDPETNEECPHGVQGEVCTRGYHVMKGYYNNPEASEKAIDSDGWLHSGDLGVMDEHGYLSITGRLKDMIIRGGENIYPREIEEFLYHMDAVQDVQVAGVASEKYGEEVGAFVKLKPGFDEIAPEDVKDFCRGKIAWHKIPKHVFFLEEFPMTASGKIQKFKLRELGAQWAAEENS